MGKPCDPLLQLSCGVNTLGRRKVADGICLWVTLTSSLSGNIHDVRLFVQLLVQKSFERRGR